MHKQNGLVLHFSLPWFSLRSCGLVATLFLFMLVVTLQTIYPLTAYSQGKPMNAAAIEVLKARIRDAAEKTQTIASDFIQEKEMGMISEKIISKGKFYFKRERMVRWEYLQPFSYIIIIRNDQVSVRDDNKVSQFNVQSNKVFQEINRVILGSIRGTLLSDEKNFHATFSENATAWVVNLKPLAPRLKETLSEIVIWLDRKDCSATRLEMIEPGGDFTKINFVDKKLNQPVDDEMFLVH